MHNVACRVATTVVFAVAAVSCQPSSDLIPKLTVANQTSYDLEVRVSKEGSAEWLLLGRAPRGRSIVAEQVEDLGEVWVFAFDFPGPVRGGQVRLTRDELAARGWRVRVPDEVERRLRAQGVRPSPLVR